MTAIQWTDATWNPVVGCTRVSAGCDNCYAVKETHRQERIANAADEIGKHAGRSGNYVGLTVLNKKDDRHFSGEVVTVPEALDIPLRWRKGRKVFVNSMSDLFHKDVPFDFIDKVFAVMALCPQHTFQILTKRPERMAEYLQPASTKRITRLLGNPSFLPTPLATKPAILAIAHVAMKCSIHPLPNVWLGTSVENQETADERITHLLRCPAAVRFVSYEPALGPVDFQRALNIERSEVCGWMNAINGAGPNIDWLIIGGESGKGARPFDIAWARSAIEQCKAAGVACFVKQLGKRPFEKDRGHTGWAKSFDKWFLNSDNLFPRLNNPKGGDMEEWPEDLRVREFPR